MLVLIFVNNRSEHVLLRLRRCFNRLERLRNFINKSSVDLIHVGKLLGRVVRVRLKLNVVKVFVLHLVNIIVFVDIHRGLGAELGKHQVVLSVVGACMNNQHFLKHGFSQLILRQHAFNSEVNNLCGVLDQQLFHCDFSKTTEVLRVMSVLFGHLFVSANHRIGSVNNNADIALNFRSC